ncbi:MAG: deoxyribodipyrimidine photolyase, partial [Chloroflexota bacterium]
ASYSRAELADGETDDLLWNASQRELRQTGRIQSYVRMYWGKRLVEWFADPEEGLRTALWLNDRYALDGRSPNGVANIQWCFGLHDRPFPDRPRLGQVRPLGMGGVRRNLDLDGYVRWVAALAS